MLGPMRVPAFVMCALSVLPLAASADSMRCGKWIVNETMTTDEILQKRGEQVTERWYYKPSSGSLTMMIKILDGKVVSIERAD